MIKPIRAGVELLACYPLAFANALCPSCDKPLTKDVGVGSARSLPPTPVEDGWARYQPFGGRCREVNLATGTTRYADQPLPPPPPTPAQPLTGPRAEAQPASLVRLRKRHLAGETEKVGRSRSEAPPAPPPTVSQHARDAPVLHAAVKGLGRHSSACEDADATDGDSHRFRWWNHRTGPLEARLEEHLSFCTRAARRAFDRAAPTITEPATEAWEEIAQSFMGLTMKLALWTGNTEDCVGRWDALCTLLACIYSLTSALSKATQDAREGTIQAGPPLVQAWQEAMSWLAQTCEHVEDYNAEYEKTGRYVPRFAHWGWETGTHEVRLEHRMITRITSARSAFYWEQPELSFGDSGEPTNPVTAAWHNIDRIFDATAHWLDLWMSYEDDDSARWDARRDLVDCFRSIATRLRRSFQHALMGEFELEPEVGQAWLTAAKEIERTEEDIESHEEAIRRARDPTRSPPPSRPPSPSPARAAPVLHDAVKGRGRRSSACEEADAIDAAAPRPVRFRTWSHRAGKLEARLEARLHAQIEAAQEAFEEHQPALHFGFDIGEGPSAPDPTTMAWDALDNTFMRLLMLWEGWTNHPDDSPARHDALRQLTGLIEAQRAALVCTAQTIAINDVEIEPTVLGCWYAAEIQLRRTRRHVEAYDIALAGRRHEPRFHSWGLNTPALWECRLEETICAQTTAAREAFDQDRPELNFILVDGVPQPADRPTGAWDSLDKAFKRTSEWLDYWMGHEDDDAARLNARRELMLSFSALHNGIYNALFAAYIGEFHIEPEVEQAWLDAKNAIRAWETITAHEEALTRWRYTPASPPPSPPSSPPPTRQHARAAPALHAAVKGRGRRSSACEEADAVDIPPPRHRANQCVTAGAHESNLETRLSTLIEAAREVFDKHQPTTHYINVNGVQRPDDLTTACWDGLYRKFNVLEYRLAGWRKHEDDDASRVHARLNVVNGIKTLAEDLKTAVRMSQTGMIQADQPVEQAWLKAENTLRQTRAHVNAYHAWPRKRPPQTPPGPPPSPPPSPPRAQTHERDAPILQEAVTGRGPRASACEEADAVEHPPGTHPAGEPPPGKDLSQGAGTRHRRATAKRRRKDPHEGAQDEPALCRETHLAPDQGKSDEAWETCATRCRLLLAGGEPETRIVLLVGSTPASLATELLARGIESITVNYRHPQGVPHMYYRGDARDVLFSRWWRTVVGFPPCRVTPVQRGRLTHAHNNANHLQWHAIAFHVVLWCAPADAIMLEQPRSVVPELVGINAQSVHPYRCTGEGGECKELHIATRAMPPPRPSDTPARVMADAIADQSGEQGDATAVPSFDDTITRAAERYTAAGNPLPPSWRDPMARRPGGDPAAAIAAAADTWAALTPDEKRLLGTARSKRCAHGDIPRPCSAEWYDDALMPEGKRACRMPSCVQQAYKTRPRNEPHSRLRAALDANALLTLILEENTASEYTTPTACVGFAADDTGPYAAEERRRVQALANMAKSARPASHAPEYRALRRVGDRSCKRPQITADGAAQHVARLLTMDARIQAARQRRKTATGRTAEGEESTPATPATRVYLVPVHSTRRLVLLDEEALPITLEIQASGKPGALRAAAAELARSHIPTALPDDANAAAYTMGVLDDRLLILVPTSALPRTSPGLRWWQEAELPKDSAHLGKRVAAAALVRLQQLLAPTPSAADDEFAPSIGMGDERATGATITPTATDTAAFDARLARDGEALQLLRTRLLAEAAATGGHVGDCLAQWAERVAPPAIEAMPDGLRTVSQRFDAPSLRLTPFAHRATVLPTPPLAKPPPQPPLPDGFAPESIDDVLERWAVRAIKTKLKQIRRWHRDATTGNIHAQRPQPLALGMDAFRPNARGWIWDLRGDKPVPLDFTQHAFETHLNLPHLERVLASCVDREIVDMLTCGVQLKASLKHQIVIMPNLLSLYSDVGVHAVADELDDMLKRGWWGKSTFIPFAPWRASPRGAVPRPGGGAPRGIGDLGAPRPRAEETDESSAGGELRPSLRDSEGDPVIPVNVATGCGRRQRNLAQRMHLKESPVGHWDPELKPFFEDAMLNGCILRAAADRDNDTVITLALDFSKFFHQAFFAASEWWKLGSVMPERAPGGGAADTVRCMTEHVMTMGLAPASQIAQRLANALMQIIFQRMDAGEETWLPRQTAGVRAWLKERGALPHGPYGTQARLYDALCYTDDPLFQIVGVERTIRLLKILHDLLGPEGINLMLAKVEKWQASTGIVWTGVGIAPALGLVWIPRAKALRATAAARAAIDGTSTAADYRSLLGFLEHLRVPMGMRREMMDYLWTGLRSAASSDDLEPGEAVNLDGKARGYMHAWIACLANRPGSSILTCVARERPPPTTVRWRPQSDAAVGDVHPDGRAGLGGYLYGYYWTFATLAPITIPVAEFVAAIFNVIIFEPLLASARCVILEVDALATPTVLEADRARSDGLREALRESWLLPQMQRMRGVLRTRHIFGEGNTAADAASRGKWDVLAGVSKQLGHRLQRIQVPPEAVDYLNAVCRALQIQGHAAPDTSGEDPPPGAIACFSRIRAIGTIHIAKTTVAGAVPVKCDKLTPLGCPWPPSDLQSDEAITEAWAELLAAPDGAPASAHDKLIITPRFANAIADDRRSREMHKLERRLRAGVDIQLICSRACANRCHANPEARCHITAIAEALRRRVNPTTGNPAEAGGTAIRFKPLRCCDEDWADETRKTQAEGHTKRPRPARTPSPTAHQRATVETATVGPRPAGPDTPDLTPTRGKAALQPRERHGSLILETDEETNSFSRPMARRAHEAKATASKIAVSRAGGQEKAKLSGMEIQADQVAKRMAASLRADTSRYALRPDDAETIDLACARLVDILQRHAPATTRANEASNWKHWEAFCAHMNTSPWRDDARANAGGENHEREFHLLALGLLYIYARMKPAKRSPNNPPKPASALAVLRGVRRLHKRLGHKMVDLTLAIRLAASLAEDFVTEHGPELLQAHRTEPLTNAMVEGLVHAVGAIGGGVVIDNLGLRDASLKACFATMARTGFRADEVALRSGAEHTVKRLSRWHLRWRFGGGEITADPTPEQLRGMRQGDYAILIPPTSKADQFGLEWGPNPIYLRYDAGETVSAAAALRDLELVWPLHGEQRRAHALFVEGNKQPLGQQRLRDAFAQRLTAAGFTTKQVQTVSLHSFRVYLACSLLALGRSHDEIKALLRWKSDEAIRIYARLNPGAYADLLVGVGDADVDSMRTHNLAQATVIDSRVGAFLDGRAQLEKAAAAADHRDAEDADGADIDPDDDEGDEN